MKRLFTLAIMAMIASLTFAQAPLAKKATKKNEVVNIHAIEKKMNEAKALKAAQAEKAAAAQVTSASVLRRSVKDNATEMSLVGGGKVLEGVKFNSTRTVVPGVKGHKSAKAAKATTVKGKMLFGHEVSLNPLKTLALQNNFTAAPAQRTTTQEGNVTVTTDANGIITDVAGVEAKAYTRGETGTTYFISDKTLKYSYQSGTVMVVEDGDNVYIKDPLTRYTMGSWVKGTKEGNIISVANRQPLAYSSNYNATLSLRWGNVSDLKSAFDKNEDAITFSVDGDVLTLEGTSSLLTSEEGYVIGLYWDDDDSYQGYWDAETVPTYNSEYVAPSTELVTVPEGTETATWYLNGESSEADIVNQEVLVGANEDMEFYVQGLCVNFPEAWVKGIYDAETNIVTFEKGQYIGNYGGVYDMWFAGTSDWATLCDVTATYDAEAGTLTFDPEVDILENAKPDEHYCLEYYSNFVLSMEPQSNDDPNTGGELTVTTDANGIITSVTGGTAKYYQRSNEGTAYFVSSQQMVFDSQSGTVTVIEDGDDVYMKDPISRYNQNSWVKGTKADGKIIIPAKQPLAYNANYDATISLRWGLIDAEGNIAAVDDHADAFTFTIDGDKLILEGTESFLTAEGDAYFMGAFWDDDNTPTGYGDAETVLVLDNEYVAPTTELVTVPETAEVAEWYMNGNQISSTATTAVKNRVIKVAADEMDVYVQGLSSDFPESWVKGTLDEETGIITFAKNQWMGFENYYELDIWFLGFDTTVGDICAPTAVYDFETSTITFNEQVVINGATDRLYYLERYDNVVLSMEEKEYVEPTITDLTATLPYFNGFDTEEEQAEVAIYDANEDGKTFTFATDANTESTAARYTYSSANNGDDYLVFPGLELKAGVSYKVSVDARSYSASWPERFEVVAGKEAKASQLNIPVIEPTDVASGEYITFSNDAFTVEEDGTYFFAVHGISDADAFYLFIENFSVAELDTAAPVAVADLAVVAAEDGDNEATITFTAPTLNIGGEALEGDLKAMVTCDGEKVKNLLLEPGEAVELIHKVAEPGFHIFTVVVSQGEHLSERASVKAYIGEDTPTAVLDLAVTDNGDDTIGLTWDAPTTGVNDGIILPANLKYNVYPVEMIEFWGMLFPEIDYENPYLTGLAETNATVDFETNVGEQAYSYIAVTAENNAGESNGRMASFLTGAPYTLPFIETLPGNLTYWWGGDVDDDNYDLDGGIVAAPTTEDEDGDLAFLFDAKTAGWMELYSGKIDLSGKAALSFDYAATAGVTEMKLYVSAPGKEDVLVDVIEPWLAPTDESGAEIEKATVQVSLAEFVDEPWVRLTLRAEFSEEAELLVDNITIIGFDNELVAKAISAPAKAEPNTEFNVTVTIANQGANAAEGYTVELYKNGEKVAEEAGEAIASAATATVTFAQALTITEAEAEFKAVVVYDIDENEANNETETVTVAIKLPNYPAVDDLTAAQAEDESVVLSWNEPNLDDMPIEPITEDFEGAEPFGLTVDGWTLVDEDGGPMGGIEGIDLGVASGAWFVFDNSGEDFNESFVSHSGNKFMSTMYNKDGSQNKDWMISPALYGEAQTISFWATSYTDRYGLEKMEVLYSTTDKELASFVSLGTVEVPAEWTEYTYDLPEGAKYFAIRYVSSDVFMLWVDDVTFIPAEGASIDLALVGYNVYRDGVKVNEAPVAETTYVDADATDGEHTYFVTVVYEQGESAPSNIATVEVATGISEVSEVSAASANGNVYSVSGAMLRKGNESLNGLAKGVYIINGKKVVVK